MTLEEYFIDKMVENEQKIDDLERIADRLKQLTERQKEDFRLIKESISPYIEYSDLTERFYVYVPQELIWEGSPQYNALKEMFRLEEPKPFPDAEEEQKEASE